ncbi:hypothetical protein PPERSA_08634 [Pseudocohnilembus persalinus]|uniref:Transmembrane protein n=1 Tax=Pseudocohnilembus persalinus TaxID=266149 RepID=A0A0V0R533_PSEPJ|nr:hypothetical protein PPERSA_08634 [Pseudocohnilembus persalinus]|eukprot:KRX09602.1 hypothetical protein PPERSA_08634 [Pseudocohnilembus persalinus]
MLNKLIIDSSYIFQKLFVQIDNQGQFQFKCINFFQIQILYFIPILIIKYQLMQLFIFLTQLVYIQFIQLQTHYPIMFHGINSLNMAINQILKNCGKLIFKLKLS